MGCEHHLALRLHRLTVFVGARRELGLMRHACLAFMVIDDDGLDHMKLPRDEHPTQRERGFIDSNSPSFQSCA
jgi:hypothetical protein